VKQLKISVIVPVYKVEPYLRKCLDSIVGQTYSNLEIILVDDGSPDNCGAICDEYAAKDDRVIVLHQENAGVSAARNAGLNVSTGDYISFVDSDDWIEPDMYEYLLDAMTVQDADIASCGFSRDCDGSAAACEEIEAVTTGAEAISMLIEREQIVEVIWNKLYRAGLWQDLCFPTGMRYEDAAVFHIILDRARKIVFLPQTKYHYSFLSSGFMQTADFHQSLVRWQIAAERRAYLQVRYPVLQQALDFNVVSQAMYIWPEAWNHRNQLTPNDRKALAGMAHTSRRCSASAKAYGRFGKCGRLQLWLTQWPHVWAFGLSKLVRQMYRWKHTEER